MTQQIAPGTSDSASSNGGLAAERAFASQLLTALIRFKGGDFDAHLPADLLMPGGRQRRQAEGTNERAWRRRRVGRRDAGAQSVDLSVVLMDIMMPEMVGRATMRGIRKGSRFRTLPILALTAKATKGDREKRSEAGASDYIAKPVNTEKLLSVLRVRLYC